MGWWFNHIEGSLQNDLDLVETTHWLERARAELPQSELSILVDRIHDWLLKVGTDHSRSDDLLNLLQQFDPTSDARRRIEVAQERARQRAQRDEAAKRVELMRKLELQRREAELERQRQVEMHLQAERARAELKRALVSKLTDVLDADFFAADEVRARDASSELVNEDELANLRADFVQDWIGRERLRELDCEQAAAVAVSGGNIHVVARAGSGKTRTLVTRSIFLQKHCQIPRSELLLLAFNKKAAEKMKAELAKTLGANLPHVMTFHALAYAIVHPEEAMVKDEPDEGDLSHSAVAQRIVNDFLEEPVTAHKVRRLMLDRFRSDWDQLERSGLSLSMADGLQFRRSLIRETLRGEYVRSRGERIIANTLFEHDVPYVYERNHWWNGRNYRPDFTLEGRNVVIEYFGLAGQPEYDKQRGEKRKYWAEKSEWSLLEYGPELLSAGGPGALERRILEDLRRLSIPFRKLPEAEVWAKIRGRCITRFATVLKDFVGRCRKACLDGARLRSLLSRHSSIFDWEKQFLSVGSDAFDAYLARMSHEGNEDFDGLLERATRRVAAGHTKFNRRSGAGDLARMRFILIDEYQDFSPLFHGLIEVVRRASPEAKLFCVGDDWQAINGFAGSDLKYFREFGSLFPSSITRCVTTNYRSAEKIVEVGNRIMEGRGVPAKASKGCQVGRVLLANPSKVVLESEECLAWPGDQITPAIRRLVRKHLDCGKGVAVLSRRDGVPYFVSSRENQHVLTSGLKGLHRQWTRGLDTKVATRVATSTAHGFKGMEEDVVIVIDALDRSYPLIHPDWVFGRVFGDSLEGIIEAERRLFYVACTRAKETLILLTEKGQESPFLLELKDFCEPLDWAEYPPFLEAQGGWIVKVGSRPGEGPAPTISRRDILKAHGFAWANAAWKHWWLGIGSAAGLPEVLDEIEAAPWLVGSDGLEIRVCTVDGRVIETLEVRGNRLKRVPVRPPF